MQRAPETIFGARPWGAVLALGRCAPGARGPLRSLRSLRASGAVGPLGGHPPVLRPRPPLGAACGFRGVALRGRGFGFESGPLGDLDTTSNPTADALCDRVRVSGVGSVAPLPLMACGP